MQNFGSYRHAHCVTDLNTSLVARKPVCGVDAVQPAQLLGLARVYHLYTKFHSDRTKE